MKEIDDANRSTRARGRWKLLRNAVLDTRSLTPSADTTEKNKHSIHSFGGYGMLETRWVTAGDIQEETAYDHSSLLKTLRDIDRAYNCNDKLLPRLMRLMDALGLDTLDIPLQCDPGTDLSTKLLPGWTAVLLEDHSSSETLQLYRLRRKDESNKTSRNYDFGIKAYYRRSDDTNSTTLYVLERRVQRTTLQDLICHRSTGIDNTGSVCVWDAAQTLAWAICTLLDQNALEVGVPPVVLELGSGMAALPTLMLLKHLHRREMISKIFITDGQMDSVENNRMNCLLLELELRRYVECLLLKWSLNDMTMDSIQATITLVADCTHFEEYHGELLWTMIYHTAVGGTVYLCQPKRGMSWDKFASLIERVNICGATPLMVVSKLAFEDLDRKRDQCEPMQKLTGYRADVHHPHIFAVSKIRQETEEDRQCIMESIRSRSRGKA